MRKNQQLTEKIIKHSHRGLTFSFQPCGSLDVGGRYDYLLDSDTKTITIMPAIAGRYKLSRKKTASGWKPLVDLRNRDVLDVLNGMRQLRIRFDDANIIISDAATSEAATQNAIISFPRASLSEFRRVSGLGDVQAVSALLGHSTAILGTQLGDSKQPLSVSTIQKDLADIYTVVSLFSGAGVLDYPFAQDQRFAIQYAIDYDAAACETYRHNIGTHIVHGDIHHAFTESGYPLDSTVAMPDVIIGGPSCKPFSNANRHTRLADHQDSDLLMQYMRIVKVLKPKVFAIENVPEVLSACDGAYYDAIREVAHECGYELKSKVVQDNLVGGYTTRKRAIIIGSSLGEATFPSVSLVSGSKTAGDALGRVNPSWSNYGDVTLPGDETKRRMSFVPQGGNYLDIPEAYRTPSKNRHSCTYRRLAWNEPSPTIVNWRKPPLIHPLEDRTLTVAEAKALQGLPGSFRVYGSLGQMQQQIGNAVPVAIGTYLKNTVLSTLTRAQYQA